MASKAWSSSQICVSKDICNLSLHFNKRSFVCSACQISKSHKLPFPLSQSRASCHLELIHADLCCPASQLSTNGAFYFILFLDDYSRFSGFIFLILKIRFLLPLFTLKLLLNNSLDVLLRFYKQTMVTEFTVLSSFLKSDGIIHQFSCPCTSKQNGRGERKLRHIIETGLTLLLHLASLPLKYRHYAFSDSSSH